MHKHRAAMSHKYSQRLAYKIDRETHSRKGVMPTLKSICEERIEGNVKQVVSPPKLIFASCGVAYLYGRDKSVPVSINAIEFCFSYRIGHDSSVGERTRSAGTRGKFTVSKTLARVLRCSTPNDGRDLVG